MGRMALRLIVFDLDGTLIDSAADICAAVNHAIKSLGLPSVSLEETKASIGEGVSRLIPKLLALKGATSADTDEIVKKTLDYYAGHLVTNTTIYPGVRETLDQLNGVQKAVVSNKLTRLAEQILGVLDLLQFFDLIAGVDSSPERKPSPGPILRVLSLLGVSPHEAIVVGDSLYDIEAGRAAGVKTVAVTYGYGKPGFSEGADFVIDRFPELLDVLKAL